MEPRKPLDTDDVTLVFILRTGCSSRVRKSRSLVMKRIVEDYHKIK